MGISGQTRNDFSNVFSSATASIPASSALVGRNPLEGTHELRQACQLCFVKKGKGCWNSTGLIEKQNKNLYLKYCEIKQMIILLASKY